MDALVGPCCRQNGFLVAIEWLFTQDEEARDQYKKEYQKKRKLERKAKKAQEGGAVREYEEGEIEG